MSRLHLIWLTVRGLCLCIFWMFVVGLIFEIDRELPP